jgi:hypothetical protein
LVCQSPHGPKQLIFAIVVIGTAATVVAIDATATCDSLRRVVAVADVLMQWLHRQ